MRKCYCVMIFMLLFGSVCLAEENSVPRFEAGAQFTALDLRGALGEKPAGIGGRFGYNLNGLVTLESEVNYFPQNPSGNFGETEALFGVKAGRRFGRFGIFGKARPGFVHFGGDFYRHYNGINPTYPAVDVGGVFEFYPKQHVGIRADWGDTIIAFGDRLIRTGAIEPYGGGTRHNFQTTIGVVFRF